MGPHNDPSKTVAHPKANGESNPANAARRRFLQSSGVLAAAVPVLGCASGQPATKPDAEPVADKRPGELAGCDPRLIDRLLALIELEIIPLTQEGVSNGNKIFGAGMLRKSDFSTIIAATNHETENPLWHGEGYAIKSYYDRVNADESKRVDPKETVFLATHEPCPLCSSAIAWGGYDNYYYLFSNEDSRDSFNIGHDLKILNEVFKLDPGEYARQNAYWTAYGIIDLINNCDEATKTGFLARVGRIKNSYAEMSEIYQVHKGENKNILLR